MSDHKKYERLVDGWESKILVWNEYWGAYEFYGVSGSAAVGDYVDFLNEQENKNDD